MENADVDTDERAQWQEHLRFLSAKIEELDMVRARIEATLVRVLNCTPEGDTTRAPE